jgi:hypothetical protein
LGEEYLSGYGDEDGILNYINCMMGQIWVKYKNLTKWGGNVIRKGTAIPVTGRGGP